MADNTINTGSKIPTSADIASIAKTAISVLDDVVSFCLKSPMSKDGSKIIKKTVNNIIDSVNFLADSIFEIQTAMKRLDPKGMEMTIDMITSNPIALLKGDKPVAQKGAMSVIDEYRVITEAISYIAELGTKFSKKDVTRGMNFIIRAVKILVKSQKYLNKEIGSAKALQSLFAIAPKIVEQLVTSSKVAAEIASTIKNGDLRKLKKTVSRIFQVHAEILYAAGGIGTMVLKGKGPRSILGAKIPMSKKIDRKAIFTGIATISAVSMMLSKIMPNTSALLNDMAAMGGGQYIKTKIGIRVMFSSMNSIMSHLVKISEHLDVDTVRKMAEGYGALFALSTGLANVFKNIDPIITSLTRIGSSWKHVLIGLQVFKTLFYIRSRSFLSGGRVRGQFSLMETLLSISANTSAPEARRIAEGLIAIIVIGKVLEKAMSAVMPAVEMLQKMGNHTAAIIKGIFVFRLLFGQGLIMRQWSLLSVISSVKINKRMIKSIKMMSVLSIALSVVMVLMAPVINTLILMGRNSRRIRRGIKSFRLLIDRMIDIIYDPKVKKLKIKNIMESAKKLVVLAGVFMLIAIPIKALAILTPFILLASVGMLLLYPMILMMVGMLALVSKFKKVVKKGSKVMMDIGKAYSGFALAMIGLAGMGLLESVAVMIAISGTILLAVLVSKIAGKAAIKASLGVMVMIKLSLCMLTVALTLWAISKIIGDLDFKSLLIFMGAVTVLLLMFTGMGFLIQYIAPFLGLMLVSLIAISISLILMAKAIKDIQDMDFDPDAVNENISSIIGCYSEAVGSLLEIGFTDILEAGVKAMLLLGISASIGSMAETLQDIASMNIPVEFDEHGRPKAYRSITADDFKNASINAANIFTFWAYLVDDKAHTTEYGTVGGVLTDKLLERITISTRRKIERLNDISGSIGAMAETLVDIASLRFATSWNQYGKPTSFSAMKADDFAAAAANAGDIFTFWASLVDDKVHMTRYGFVGGILTDKLLERITLSARRKIARLNRISGSIGAMAETLVDVASLHFATEWDKEGKPTSFRSMTADDYAAAAANAADIFTFWASLVDNKIHMTRYGFVGGVLTDSLLDRVTRSARQKIERLNNISGSIGTMAETLADVASLRFATEWNEDGKPVRWATMGAEQFDQASHNIVTVIETIMDAVSSDKMTKFLDTKFKYGKDNIEMICTLGNSIGGMVGGIEKMVSGQFPIEWDETTGKPIKFVPFDNILKRKNALVRNLQDILSIYLRATVANKEMQDAGSSNAFSRWFKSSNIDKSKRTIEAIRDISPVVADIINSVTDLAKKQTGAGDVENIRTSLSSVMGTYTSALSDIADIDSDDLSDNTKSFVKVIDKANSIDVDKIKTITSMFNEMAEFSKSISGDFDRLADVLNDKLVDVLVDIKDTLTGISSSAGSAASAISASQASMPSAPLKEAPTEAPSKAPITEKQSKEISSKIDAVVKAIESLRNATLTIRPADGTRFKTQADF